VTTVYNYIIRLDQYRSKLSSSCSVVVPSIGSTVVVKFKAKINLLINERGGEDNILNSNTRAAIIIDSLLLTCS
jgi:hypothetical protein